VSFKAMSRVAYNYCSKLSTSEFGINGLRFASPNVCNVLCNAPPPHVVHTIFEFALSHHYGYLEK